MTEHQQKDPRLEMVANLILAFVCLVTVVAGVAVHVPFVVVLAVLAGLWYLGAAGVDWRDLNEHGRHVAGPTP